MVRPGFSLSEIILLLSAQSGPDALSLRWQQMARAKLADMERLIAHAHAMRASLLEGLHCNCANFGECVDCVIRRCGRVAGSNERAAV